MKKKIVLAYSGGLDTSVAIKWLQEHYQYDVVAVAADLGEGKALQTLKSKALNIGAVKAHIIDVKKEYADDFLAKALKANALYEGVYPLISALSRPLISKKLVEIAEKEHAVAVAHGCTGKGNDQVRFDVSIKTLNPNLDIVAPVRECPMSREEAIHYAEKNGIPLPINLESPYSIDLNLWGRSCECGALEDPWVEPPEDAFAWTVPVSRAPESPEQIEIQFQKGVATHLNGQSMSFDKLIAQLNTIAGKHGVGRIDHVENRLIGIKSREIYEAPAAVSLIKAHQALESLCLTRDVFHFKKIIEQKFENLVYEGLWYSPLFEAVNAFIDHTQNTVSGTVKLKLHKGNATVIGRQSHQSLYQYDLATYKSDDQFDHKAATGFIKIWGLPMEVNALVNQKKSESL